MTTVEELYKKYETLDQAGAEAGKHADAYKSILAAVKGSEGEKRLAPGFIAKFFKHFPALADSAIDALLDLCEEETLSIRKMAIKALPNLCSSDNLEHLPRISDVLTQLLQCEDDSELKVVREALIALFKLSAKGTLTGVFSQIMSGEESAREQAIKFLKTTMPRLIPQFLHKDEDAEKFFLAESKKVLTGEVNSQEFDVFMSLIPILKISSKADVIQELADVVAKQAGLTSDFQPSEGDHIHKLIVCLKAALPLYQKGASVSTPLLYLCTSVLPALERVSEEGEMRLGLLQLTAEMSPLASDKDMAEVCVAPVYDLLLVYCPPAPENVGEEKPGSGPNVQFSFVECLLFSLQQFAKLCPGFLDAEKLTVLRQRLQYLARCCQLYTTQLKAALRVKTAEQRKKPENHVKVVALKTTSNISALIKDFFRSPPTLKIVVTPSWVAKATEEKTKVLSVKTETTSTVNGKSTTTKRSISPIQFDKSSSDDSSAKKKVRPSTDLYAPPSGRFSKDIGDAPAQATTRGRGSGFRGGRGWRGRGRGGRGWGRRY